MMLGLLAQVPVNPVVTVGFDIRQLIPLLGTGGPILVVVASVTYWLARWRTSDQIRSLKSQLKNMTGERDIALDKHQFEQTQVTTLTATTANLTDQLKSKIEDIHRLKTNYDRIFQAGQKLHIKYQELKVLHATLGTQYHAEMSAHTLTAANLASTKSEQQIEKAELEELRIQKFRVERGLRRIRKSQGYLTQEKALQKVPKFRPLSERRRPIISVLNLKGGVGKTTVTAHLGAALARKGYRVLLIDLDLQGSLTALMLPQRTISHQGKVAKRLLQDFFRIAAAKVLTKLSPFTVSVPDQPADCAGSLSIVPTTDALAYSELDLSLGWLLKKGTRDARFLLRKALHFKVDNSDFDIVLLDCPPLLSIACVNALAASDYLLTPTLLSAKAIERVPVLLQAVNQDSFKKHVNSQLKVMGVLANRARRSPPAGDEGGIWQDLPKYIDSAYVSQIKQFETVIKMNVDISSAEEQFTHPKAGSDVERMFNELANEVEKGLPSDCRKTSPQTA